MLSFYVKDLDAKLYQMLEKSQNKKQFASLFSNEFKILVKNPVINHERGKDREVLMTSGTYPWSFVTQICHNGPQCHGDDHKTLMTST